MTPFTNADMKLSRLTVATLEDLGYLVNYNGADRFSASDLPRSCRCNRRLGGGGDSALGARPPTQRKLSAAEVASKSAALTFGQEVLRESNAEQATGDLRNVGSEIISVFYRVPDTGQIAHVIVTGTNDPFQWTPSP